MSDRITREQARELACLVQSKPTVANKYDSAADKLARYVLDSRETVEQARERFERWRLSRGCTPTILSQKHADGTYRDRSLRLLWGGWLHALAADESLENEPSECRRVLVQPVASVWREFAQRIERIGRESDCPGDGRELLEISRQMLAEALRVERAEGPR